MQTPVTKFFLLMRTSATDTKSVPTWLQGKPTTVNPTNSESEFAMQ